MLRLYCEFASVLRNCEIRLACGAPLHIIGLHGAILSFEATALSARREAAPGSEGDSRAIVEAIPQKIWTARADGSVDFVNGRVLEYFGCSLEQMIGGAWLEGVHPDDRAACLARWQRSVASSEPYEVDARCLRASDRSYRWHALSALPVRDDQGSVVRWYGISTDIEDRRRAEDRLQLLADASAALASGFDVDASLGRVARLAVPLLADCCVFDVVSDNGRTRRVAVAHVDSDAEQAVQTVGDRYASEIDPRHPVARVLQTGEPLVVAAAQEAFARRPDVATPEHALLLRRSRFSSFMTLPLPGRDRLYGTLTLANVGDRPAASDDLLLASDIARRAGAALENARLYREATVIAGARQEMLAVVSHDLRNPLSAVLTAAALIDRALPAEEGRMRKHARTIRRSAERMSRLIHDLLDLASIEGGRVQLRRQPVDVEGLLAEAAEMMQPLALERGLSLAVTGASTALSVDCDRERVLQIFSNLVGNALKFTPPGGSISIDAAAQGNEVWFSVRDTGFGLMPEQLDRLFERYWQARRTPHEGIGLGLSIVKGLVDAHGGRIWAESKAGHGATFSFTLPA